MKVLLSRRPPEKHKLLPPKRKIKKCTGCNSIFMAERADCEEGVTVLNVPAYYVKCPICSELIYIGEIYKVW